MKDSSFASRFARRRNVIAANAAVSFARRSPEIRKLTLIAVSIFDGFHLLLRLPVLLELFANDMMLASETIEIYVACETMLGIFQSSVCLREAFWFSRRGRVFETEVHLLVHRSHHYVIKVCGDGEFHTATPELEPPAETTETGLLTTSHVFLKTLAMVAEDGEFLHQILDKVSVFHLALARNLQRGNIIERTSSSKAFLANEKYSMASAIQNGYPVALAVATVVVLYLAAPKRGVQLGLGLFGVGIGIVFLTQMFLMEAIREFSAHNRLVNVFLYSIGHFREHGEIMRE